MTNDLWIFMDLLTKEKRELLQILYARIYGLLLFLCVLWVF